MKDTTILLNTRTPKDEGKFIKFDAKIDETASGGYDVIIKAISLTNNLEDYEIIKYDYDNVLSKVRAGEPISGICFHVYNYDEEIEGNTNSTITPLRRIELLSNGGIMAFNSIYGSKSGSGLYLFASDIVFRINSNGELSGVSYERIAKTIS